MSADPWVHAYLLARCDEHAKHVGKEVLVRRFSQSPVRGQLLRIDRGQALLIIAGFGSVPADQVEAVENA